MKTLKISLIAMTIISAALLQAFTHKTGEAKKKKIPFVPPGCVFRTVMGEESSAKFAIYKTPEKVQHAVDRGLTWMATAQNSNGGWGAGSHASQNVMDPH